MARLVTVFALVALFSSPVFAQSSDSGEEDVKKLLQKIRKQMIAVEENLDNVMITKAVDAADSAVAGLKDALKDKDNKDKADDRKAAPAFKRTIESEDELIKQLGQAIRLMNKNGQGKQRNQKEQDARDKKQKQQQQQQQNNPNKPREDKESEELGSTTPEHSVGKATGNSDGAFSGSLPRRQHAQAENALKARIPAKYRKRLEEYLKRISSGLR